MPSASAALTFPMYLDFRDKDAAVNDESLLARLCYDFKWVIVSVV